MTNPRPTAAATCAARLRDQILDGDPAPGARLPPERALAAALGVTRVTLRSALHLLVAEGLIVQVQGRGTTVLDWRRAGGPALLGTVVARQPAGAPRQQALAELLAVRRALAQVVFATLAPRDPPPLAAFSAALDRFGALCTDPAPPPAALAAADLAAIAELLACTDSAVLPLCLQPVARALAALPELGAAVYRSPRENLAAWRGIEAWLSLDPAHRAPPAVLLGLLDARDAATLAALAPPAPAPPAEPRP